MKTFMIARVAALVALAALAVLLPPSLAVAADGAPTAQAPKPVAAAAAMPTGEGKPVTFMAVDDKPVAAARAVA